MNCYFSPFSDSYHRLTSLSQDIGYFYNTWPDTDNWHPHSIFTCTNMHITYSLQSTKGYKLTDTIWHASFKTQTPCLFGDVLWYRPALRLKTRMQSHKEGMIGGLFKDMLLRLDPVNVLEEKRETWTHRHRLGTVGKQHSCEGECGRGRTEEAHLFPCLWVWK